jgi:serine protease Do
MKKQVIRALFGAALAVALTLAFVTHRYTPESTVPAPVVSKVLANTVRVSMTNASAFGSGVIFHRFNHTYIITAAHVTRHARETNTVFVQLHGATNLYPTKIVNEDHKFDLALLRVVGQWDVLGRTVTFPDDLSATPIGTRLIHVGNWSDGDVFSFTGGIVNQTNRVERGSVFDQSSATIYPGSSGGGVFDTRGDLRGIVLRAGGSDWVYFKPVRLIYHWTINNELYWIFL